MATTYIHRTPAEAGNQRTWTYSAWVKRGALGSRQGLYNVNAASDPYIFAEFVASDALNIQDYDGSQDTDLVTTRLFKDQGAWYHIVIAYDTTQSTPADRIKLYVNGVQETSFSTETYCAEDFDTQMNTTVELRLGREGAGSNYFDGSMSWVQLVDGLQLAPTEFGSVDATSGIWKIKPTAYGTPGTNGFCLAMEDRSNLDLDTSSNAFTWTTSGTLTAIYDNPSNNFSTLNPLSLVYGAATFTNGMTHYTRVTNYSYPLSTMGVSSGKWYAEFKCIAGGSGDGGLGIVSSYSTSTTNWGGANANNYWWWGATGAGASAGVKSSGSTVTNGSIGTFTDGDIISIAIDCDNNRVYYGKNGTWLNSSDPVAGTDGITITAAADTQIGNYFYTAGDYGGGTPGQWDCNFGNGYFGTTAVASANADDAGIGAMEYDVPAGYYCLCTKNIKAYGG